jgi:hypothetical protein
MSPAFLVNYVTGRRHITKVEVDRWLSFDVSIFSEKNICQETIRECSCLYAPRYCMLFVNGAEDDATTCALSRGCCEVNWTAVKAACGGLSHLRKYNFLNIDQTNIILRFKENIINFYLCYVNCWFTRSDSEKHWKTPIGLRACPKNNCAIYRIILFTKRKQHAILEWYIYTIQNIKTSIT